MKDPPWISALGLLLLVTSVPYACSEIPSPIIKIINETGHEEPPRTDVFLQFGSSITFQCYYPFQNENDSLSWSRASPPHSENLTLVSEESFLKIKKAGFDSAGIYTCHHNLTSASVAVNVFELVEAISANVRVEKDIKKIHKNEYSVNKIDHSHNVNISCRFRIASALLNYDDAAVSWSAQQDDLDLSSSRFVTFAELDQTAGTLLSNLTLRVPVEDQSLYGPYFCSLEIMNQRVFTKELSISIPPTISKNSSALVYYEGDNMTYQCSIVAYPPVSVSTILWKIDEKEIAIGSDGLPTDPQYADRFRFENRSAPYDTLVVTGLKMSDRAIYSCFVANSFGNDTKAIFIRVKDSNGPIWPSLGIALEVLILIVLISYSEAQNRKKRQAERLRESQENRFEAEPARAHIAGKNGHNQNVINRSQ